MNTPPVVPNPVPAPPPNPVWPSAAHAPAEPVVIPRARQKRPTLDIKDKAKLAKAVATLEAHLNDPDPEHPRTGIAGIFPAWLQDLFALAGPQLLAFLEGLAGIVPPPVPGTPATPAVPGHPATPAVPAHAATPATPGHPATPATPAVPAHAAVPPTPTPVVPPHPAPAPPVPPVHPAPIVPVPPTH